jgi:hypothetical protein
MLGWGNCGKDPSRRAGASRERYLKFAVDVGVRKLAAIGARCATSWTWVQVESNYFES